MKNILKSVAIIMLVIIISTAFVGCRRKDDDTSSDGLMSDVNSVASDVMSNVESGMDGIIDPSTGSNGVGTSSVAQDTTSAN